LKSRILLAEDNRHDREGLTALLVSNGYQVDTAENGLFALEKLNNNDDYDIIITDLIMPVSDGIKFLHALSKGGCETPVIVITGYENIDNMLSAYQFGAIDVLYKPYDINELLSLIDKVLSDNI